MWRILLFVLPIPALADSLVASRMIRAHTMLSAEVLTQVETDFPGAVSEMAEIEGMETSVAVFPGRPILAKDLSLAAVIERNQIVVLRYVNSGLDISTEGRALMRGAIGETIEVMNLNSRTKVTGQIGPNGVVTVGPAS